METDQLDKEYIDVDDALGRIGGNMDFYKRLLGRFVGGNNIDSLEEALKSGDMEEAARFAHTIKGVSANLSLVAVRAASADLEQVIKNGDDYSAGLETLKSKYQVTAEKIAEIID